jgi:prepilin-type N-terminal cleavage/methylation domain-containing protein
MAEQINLALLPPNPTAEQILALYTKLTGKEPTQEEIDRLKARMVMGERIVERVITPDAGANGDWPKRTKDVKLGGFTLVEVLVVLAILLVIVSLICAGAANRDTDKTAPARPIPGQGGYNYVIRTIDGCEYIEATWMTGYDRGLYSLTHKGNCSNPIHVYNAESK